ncbi:MAG: radical SAM protein [Thermoplasmata archaeon]|nr:MAG: radical SAM protein [Thermoplasmata archaeon]
MFRILLSRPEMIKCTICQKSSEYISKALGVCIGCVRSEAKLALAAADRAHDQSRKRFALPSFPPKSKLGAKCKICANGCEIPEDGRGFCGLRANKEGKIRHLAGIPSSGILESYHDPLPTNCVADWVCPGGTGCGFPEFSYSDRKPEYGYNNLAVFYGACTFDCLFCQNWHYRLLSKELSPLVSAHELASRVDEKTSCICYFGGDPTAQLPHAIKTSKIALKKAKGRILRVCWESNGTMTPSYLKTIAEISMKTGGCIKIDLKTWDENLNRILCGVPNTQTKKSIKFLAEYGRQRREPPFLVVSTLLVPGYVDVQEVGNIAKFLASLDPQIPYSLLGFHPDFEMNDMPTTSKSEANECKKAALEAGLENVRIGNIHLLA